jgi:hypothetical protein
MPESASNHQLNKGFRLHLGAMLYFLSRIMVAASLLAIPAVYLLQGRLEKPVILGAACLCVALLVGFFTAASGLNCAACGSPVLMDNGNRKHPNANRFPGFNHRTRVAWDILFGSSYQCMYCLTRCRCKKSWGAKSAIAARTSTYSALARPPEQSFAGSIFGGLSEPSIQPENSAAGVTDEGTAPERARETPRAETSGFAAARVFPNATTVPVSPIEAAPGESRPWQETVPFSPAQAPPVFPAAPVLSPVFPVSASPPTSASPPDRSGTATTPRPWTIPTNPIDHAMNASSNEPAPAANPFLTAAPATPPPSEALTADLPGSAERPAAATAVTAGEFPFAPSKEQTETPPPWTIPSMPSFAATAGVPRVASAATAAVTPLSAAPRLTTSPVAKPVPGSGQLLREVIIVLEEGQRNLANAFKELIEKLERSLAAAAAAPQAITSPVSVLAANPAPVSAPPTGKGQAAPPPVPFTAPVPLVQPAAPPSAPNLPDLLTSSRNTPLTAPVLLPSGAALAKERTAFVPLPVAPAPALPGTNWAAPAAPVTAPAVPFAAPPPPTANPFTTAAPSVPAAAESGVSRRRFAKPSTLAAQHLNEVLKDAFTNPAGTDVESPPAVKRNGSTSSVPTVDSLPPAFSFTSPASPSPFGVSESPLSAPPGVTQVPAPFTFLRNEGEHFTPSTPDDSLEPESPPWLQPIGSQAARN